MLGRRWREYPLSGRWERGDYSPSGNGGIFCWVGIGGILNEWERGGYLLSDRAGNNLVKGEYFLLGGRWREYPLSGRGGNTH